MEPINTQNLIAQVRAEIADNGFVPDAVDFADVQSVGGKTQRYHPKALQTALQSAETGFLVQYTGRYIGNPVKVLAKKVMRKLMLFFVEPLVYQQNEYNSAVMQTLGQLDARAREAEARVAALEKQLAEQAQTGGRPQ